MKIKNAFKDSHKEHFTQVGEQSPGILDDFAERKDVKTSTLNEVQSIKFSYNKGTGMSTESFFIQPTATILGETLLISAPAIEIRGLYGVRIAGAAGVYFDGDIMKDGVDTYLNFYDGTYRYKFIYDGLHFGLKNSISGAQTQFNLYTEDGDGTDGNFINIFGVGTYDDHTTNYEKCVLQYAASSQIFTLKTLSGGTGTSRPLWLGVGAYVDAIVLAIDGTTTIKNGIYNSSDGTPGMTGTKTFLDATARTNTVVIKNGLITSWSQC